MLTYGRALVMSRFRCPAMQSLAELNLLRKLPQRLLRQENRGSGRRKGMSNGYLS